MIQLYIYMCVCIYIHIYIYILFLVLFPLWFIIGFEYSPLCYIVGIVVPKCLSERKKLLVFHFKSKLEMIKISEEGTVTTKIS